MRLLHRPRPSSAPAVIEPVEVEPAPPPPSATCRAPHVALRFSPNGEAHACCANDTFPLGRIGEQSIAELWSGAPIGRLRDALDAGDYSLGCQDCGAEAASGNRAHSPAVQFDPFPDGTAPWPRRLELALSNTCNLQCVHCNGDLSSAIRTRREGRRPLRSPYDDAFFAELRDVLPHVEVVVFIGGEPFLAREARRVWDLMIELDLRPTVHVTTNATVWDDEVERYLRTFEMRVAVSIDGATAGVNDAIRVGSHHAEVTANRDRFRAVSASYGAPFAVNHCLMVANWHELGDFLVQADALGDRVELIPVFYPAGHSLFCLPAEELRPIVAALDAESVGLRPLLQGNRAVWDGALAQLRGHLARLDEGSVPVTLSARRLIRRNDDRIEAARDDLAGWAGRDALVVEVGDDIITAISHRPRWSEALDPRSWVGGPVAELMATVGRGWSIQDLEISERPGVNQVAFTLEGSGGSVPCRSTAFEWDRVDGRDATVLIAAAGPLPKPRLATSVAEPSQPSP